MTAPIRRTESRPDRRGRRASASRRSKRGAWGLESLEGRLLLASDTISVSVAGAVTFQGSTDANAITVGYNPAAMTYTFGDQFETITATSSNAGVTVSGSGTNTVVLTYTAGAITSLGIDGGGGGDQIFLRATGVPTSITESGMAGAGSDSYDLGSAASGIQGIVAPVTISDSTGPADVLLDDGANTGATSATLNVDNVGQTGTLTGLAPATISFTPDEISVLTIDGGSGADTFNINQTIAAGSIILNTGSAANSVNVLATAGSLAVVGSGGVDTVTLGTTGPTGSLSGFVKGVFFKDTGTSSTLNVNDQGEMTARTVTFTSVTSPNPTNFLNGLFADAISFDPTSVGVLNVNLGLGGNSVAVPFTPAPTTTFTSTGADTYAVQGTTAGKTLNVQSAGPDTAAVNIGNAGLVSGILGPVDILSDADRMVNLTIDDSADVNPTSVTFSNVGALATFQGLAPATIGVAGMSTLNLSVKEGPGVNGLVVDSSNLAAIPNLSYDFGQNPAGTGFDTLRFEGTGSGTADFTPSGPGGGSIIQGNLMNMGFSNLNPAGGAAAMPIVDTASLPGLSYLAPAAATAVSMGDGPIVSGLQTAMILGGEGALEYPTFELANAAAVTLDTTATTAGATVTLNETDLAAGLTSIALSAGSTPDTLLFDASPAGVHVGLDAAAGNDSAAVILSGVGSASAVSSIDGGPGVDTINFNAAGLLATLLAPGDPSLPAGTPAGFAAIVGGGHALAFGNFESITLTNTPAPAPSLFAVPALSVAAAQPLDDALVATFTTTDGAGAGDFTAIINWGDGTSSTGTVAADPMTPGSFDVTGSHTYATVGSKPVSVTVTEAGRTSMTTVGGVPATITTTASAPITLQTTTVTVTAMPLSSAGAIFTASSGQVATGYVANFTDPNGPGSTYAATIAWGDGTTSAATAITTLSSSPTSVFSAVAGAHAYAKAGTYDFTVTITSSLGLSTVAGGVANVSATPLTVAGTTFVAVRGVSASGVVAGFSDPSTLVPTYTEIINWGDGTSSAATGITKVATTPSGGSSYVVDGSHTYATTGTFPISVSIVSSAGGSATATSSATVFANTATIATLPVVAGVGVPFTGSLGTLTDNGGAEPIDDYSVFVVYNDGSDPVQATLLATASPNVFVITAPHSFAYAGTFTGYIAVAGPEIIATSAALTSTVSGFSIFPTAISPTQNAAFTAQVAVLYGPSPTGDGSIVAEAPPAGYQLTIDWGDGSPTSLGIINADGSVFASHTYATSGTFTLTEILGLPNVPQSFVVTSESVTVAAAVIPLTGMLAPSSNTGPSDTDSYTDDNSPTFTGTAQPGDTVQVFAQLSSGLGSTITLGQATADASGNWSVTSVVLPDGAYYVAAEELDPSGNPVSVFTIYGADSSPLTIDTIGPRITGVDFNRTTGVIQVTFNDERSGLDPASITSDLNYQFRAIPNGKKSLPITSLAPRSVVVSPIDPETIVATIKSGIRLPAGKYLLTIVSGGVEDLAGNALDGEFYGYFPSGNGQPGGDFSSRLSAGGAVVYNTNPLNKQQPVTLSSVKAASTVGDHTPKGALHVRKAVHHSAKP